MRVPAGPIPTRRSSDRLVHGGRDRRTTTGFTLVEVILAIGIATGLLIIALTFYRQTAELRGQILTESERLATLRLVMDRVAADLRAAQSVSRADAGFSGESDALTFTKSALPMSGAGAAGNVSDLVRVSFTTVKSTEGTNTSVAGFNRSEVPISSGRLPERPPVVALLSDSTNAIANRVEEPLTDLIRFVHFRYWDGGRWQESWTNTAPPAGVEIVLGSDPLPDDAMPETYPYEQFRRVVALPAGRSRQKPGAQEPEVSLDLP